MLNIFLCVSGICVSSLVKRLFIFFSPFFPPLQNLCFYLYVHRRFPLSPQLQVFYFGYHIFQSYNGHLVLLWIFCFFAETFHVIIASSILVILALKISVLTSVSSQCWSLPVVFSHSS